jgi:hypothetical protein
MMFGVPIDILLCGAWPKREANILYYGEVSAMFAELAEKNGLIFYPYFLEGVEGDPKLTLDGLHPNPAGGDEIVARILPSVEQLVARVRARLNAAPPELICSIDAGLGESVRRMISGTVVPTARKART